MVELKTAIKELNTKITFISKDNLTEEVLEKEEMNCSHMSTPGEIVILLRRLQDFDEVGLEPDVLKEIATIIDGIPLDRLKNICADECKRLLAEKNKKYYYIIGCYINRPMGACTTEGLEDTAEEEPLARFFEISKEEYDAYCNNSHKPDKSFDWMANSLTYEEIKNTL